MNEATYAIILSDDGADLIRKIDSRSIRFANELHYVISKGFCVLDHHFVQIQLHQPDAPWMQIQMCLQYVLGTVYLGDSKKVAGFSVDY